MPAPVPVPSLWCPIAEALHPAWKEVEARAVDWGTRTGLGVDDDALARLAATGAGELGARVTAGARNERCAQFAADQLLWLFAFDDTYCDEGEFSHDPARMAFLAADLVRAAQTGSARCPTPVVAALADLRRRLDGLGSPMQAGRWVSALRDYLFHQVWEAGHRSAGTAPDLATYLVARVSNGSMPVCRGVSGLQQRIRGTWARTRHVGCAGVE